MDELLGRAWWMLALRGAVRVLLGLLALFWPGLALLLSVAMFAAYALIRGIAAVSAAIRYRSIRTDRWIPLLLGLSVLFGIFVLAVPGAGALALVRMTGTHATVTGALLFVLGLGARNWRSAILRDRQNTLLHSERILGPASTYPVTHFGERHED